MLGTLAPLLIKNNDTTYINKKKTFHVRYFGMIFKKKFRIGEMQWRLYFLCGCKLRNVYYKLYLFIQCVRNEVSCYGPSSN